MRLLASVALLLFVTLGVVACSLSKTQARDEPKETPNAASPPVKAWMFERLASPLRESAGIAVATLPGAKRPLAFLADEADRALVVLDGDSLASIARTDLEGTPGAVIVLPTGEIGITLVDRDLFVVFGAVGEGERLELAETRRIRTGSEPRSAALTPDDRTLLLTTGGSHRVEAFDVAKLDLQWSKEVGREPRAITVSANGKTALVSFATSAEITVLELGAATTERKPKASLDLALPAAVPSCAYADPRRVARHANTFVRRSYKEHEIFWVPVAQGAPRGATATGYGALPLTAPVALQPDYRMGLAAFDVRTIFEEPELATDVKRFDAQHPLVLDCLLPRAGIASKNGALIACEGQSEVLEVEKKDHWPTVRARFKVGRGPRAIAALDDDHALVWSHFERSLSRYVPEIRGCAHAELSQTVCRVETHAHICRETAWQTSQQVF